MIFSAVALPTPGSSSSSFSEAVLMLTGPLDEAAAAEEDDEDVFFDFDELDFSELDFSALAEEEDFDDASLDFILLLLTVT